jgi:hypothetical protein
METDTTTPAVEEAPAPVAESTETKVIDRDEQGKFRNPVQPRIDELTRKARENEREAAYWRQRAENGEAQKSAPAAPVEPKPEDFTDYNDYVKAQAKFEAKQELKTELDARDKANAERQKAEKFASTWGERVTEAKSKFTDYEQVVSNSDVEVLDHVKDVINDSEHGPALIYHLASNPDIAARLNKMTPLGAAREMGRLEEALAKPSEKVESESVDDPAPVRAQKTTSAPPPAKPLNSGRSTTVDPAKLGMDDYVKLRQKQGARWAR